MSDPGMPLPIEIQRLPRWAITPAYAASALLCGVSVTVAFHALESWNLLLYPYPDAEPELGVMLYTVTVLGTGGSLLILRRGLARGMNALRMFGFGVATSILGAAFSGALAVVWMIVLGIWHNSPQNEPATILLIVPIMCLYFAVYNAPWVLPMAILIVRVMNRVAMGAGVGNRASA